MNRSNTHNKSQSAPQKAGLSTRSTALKMLTAILDRQVSLDGLLDPTNGNPSFRALDSRDQLLARAIIVTTLRHKNSIDTLINSHLDRPLPSGANSLRYLLNLSIAQILHLDIPDHAAVDIAVDLARYDPRMRKFASLVNAILRNIVRQKEQTPSKTKNPKTADNTTWFEDRILDIYGAQHAGKILNALKHEAPIDITVKSDAQHWAKELNGFILPTGSVRLYRDQTTKLIPEMPGFNDGQWWVQDAAASIPARLFGNIQGKKIADLCAAPGGKTAQLAAQGAIVTAVDQSKNRLKKLSSNLNRLDLSVEVLNANLMDLGTETLYDGVLLDAPCSSTGTARRHPDIPWTKTMEDVKKLAELQKNLLCHAINLVKPGGIIVFANCSLDPIEGEELIEGLLDSQQEVKRLPVQKSAWKGLEEVINSNGDIRCTPAMCENELMSESGMDGFFASVLQKT